MNEENTPADDTPGKSAEKSRKRDNAEKKARKAAGKKSKSLKAEGAPDTKPADPQADGEDLMPGKAEEAPDKAASKAEKAAAKAKAKAEKKARKLARKLKKVKKSKGKAAVKSEPEKPAEKSEESLSAESAQAEKQAKKLAAKLRKMQKSLRLSDGKARSVLDVLGEGVAFHQVIRDEGGNAVDYRVLEANPAFEAVTELTHDQVIGAHASEVYATARAPAPFLEEISFALESGAAYGFEGALPTTRAKLHVTVAPLDDKVFALLFEDITSRKRAESRLKARRSFLETRLKTVSEECKGAKAALEEAKREAAALGRRARSGEKLMDQNAKLKDQLEAMDAAFREQATTLRAETKRRKLLETELGKVSEARDKMQSILGALDKAMEKD